MNDFEFMTGKVDVIDKFSRDYTNQAGVTKTYYNIKVGGLGWGISFNVSKDLYDKVLAGNKYIFIGSLGASANGKYWTITDIYEK